MHWKVFRIGACCLVFGGASLSLADLSVITTTDANTLVNSALGAVAGVTVTGATYSGASIASGTYTGLTYGPFAGISSGMLLTTGDVQLAVGPNNLDDATGDNGGPTGSYNNYDGTHSIDLNDVVTLTINFHVDAAKSLSFDFAYGSEEYWYFTNSQYNDSFFAFLDGGTTTLALDPLGQAITVDNQYLTIDNRPSTFDPTNGYGLPDKIGAGTAAGIAALQYDGLTPVLRTNFDVAAGDHSLTFVIGDAGDTVLDSGVFITHLFGPGTGGGGTNPVPEPSSSAMLALGSGAIALNELRRRVRLWRKR